MQTQLQEVLEAEMEEALLAGKGERITGRLGYPEFVSSRNAFHTLFMRCKRLRRVCGNFRHYICDQARAFQQAQTEMGEELGGGGFERGDDAQAQLVARTAAQDRQEHVDTFDAGELLDELPRAGARPLARIHCSSERHIASARKHTSRCSRPRSSMW